MSSLNQLSFPKGKTLLCELCGKPATRQCDVCRCTYYCTREHQSVDSTGIHNKICSALAAIRAPSNEIGSEDDRIRKEKALKAQQRKLIDLTRDEASKFLVSGQFELAVPGALQSLRFSMAVYGEGHIDLVPAYLLLAEANLGLGHHAQVEEFLSMANWSVLKNPTCSHSLRSQVHRNFGKMYLGCGRWDDALVSLAQDVYNSSLAAGPDATVTAGGYFHMATAFTAKGNDESALAMYDKVVDSWYKHLAGVRSSGSDDVIIMSEAAAAEATSMLAHAADVRRSRLGEVHLATGEALYTLGLLKAMRGDGGGARSSLSGALNVYNIVLGAEHPSTLEVQGLLAEV